MFISIAQSLERIADALERIAAKSAPDAVDGMLAQLNPVTGTELYGLSTAMGWGADAVGYIREFAA